jgi:HAE1 family hydrophobic/amphiphilic exporter-1
VLGLAPLALGLGVGGEIQASLARVVIGGLLASTLLVDAGEVVVHEVERHGGL